MRFNATPETAISFTRLSVGLLRSWPPSTSATKTRVLLYNVSWCVAFLSSVCLLLPLLFAVYQDRTDPIILGKNMSLLCAVLQCAIKMLMCYVQRRRFQALSFEIESFCRQANISERIVLQRYVDKYKYIHIFFTFWCYLTSLFVISGPLYLPQNFPTHARYPFPVEAQPIKSIIFMHQSLVGFQASSGMTVDCQIALFIWFAAARFDLLTSRLHDVTCERELDACIKEHNNILRYTKEINRAVRLLILTTVMATTVAVIFGSLNFITDQPIPLKALYAVVVFSAGIQLFMCAFPADSLIHASANSSLGVYCSRWIEMDIHVQKKIFFIILKSQKPESITISRILPKLSLSFYASYLYTSMSYFTALRIMIGGNQN